MAVESSVISSIYNYLDSPDLVVKFQRLCGVEWKPRTVNKLLENVNEGSRTASNAHDTCRLRDPNHSCDKHSSDCTLPHQDESTSSNSCMGNHKQLDYVIKNKFLYCIFHFGATLGNEIFYITFFPFWIWNIDSFVGRRVCVFWALFMYLGQATKDILRWPRPRSPPVIRMEDKYALEYGMPSTHAMVAAGLPFSLLILTMQRYIYPFEYGLMVCITWTTIVCLSRVYLGMHSVLDIVAGLGFVVWLMLVCFPWLDAVDYFILHSDYSPLAMVFIPLFMCICYPRLDRWSTARGDTTVIMAVTSGLNLGFYLAFQHGHLHYAPTPPPYPIIYPDWVWAWKLVARFIVGTPILIITRAIVKSATLSIVAQMLNLDHGDPMHRQKLCVELPYKYLTYTAVAFMAIYVTPQVFRYLNIERETYFTEI